jgi:hypothetical protein
MGSVKQVKLHATEGGKTPPINITYPKALFRTINSHNQEGKDPNQFLNKQKKQMGFNECVCIYK